MSAVASVPPYGSPAYPGYLREFKPYVRRHPESPRIINGGQLVCTYQAGGYVEPSDAALHAHREAQDALVKLGSAKLAVLIAHGVDIKLTMPDGVLYDPKMTPAIVADMAYMARQDHPGWVITQEWAHSGIGGYGGRAYCFRMAKAEQA